MAWYNTGTVNLTNGSAAVVGVGTAFIANVDVGEGILLADGRLYEVQAVTSDTSLTLGTPYLGTNASGAGYVIAPISGYVRDLAHQAATLVQNYSQAYANRITGVAGYTGNVTIAQLLTALKTVDGAGSGLDADLLGGNDSTYYRQSFTSVVRAGTWSRVALFTTRYLFGSVKVSIHHARDAFVTGAVLQITFGHGGYGQITQLGSHGHTQIQVRLSASSVNDAYLEILDSGFAGDHNYSLYLDDICCGVTPYTTFTDGTSSTVIRSLITTANNEIIVDGQKVWHQGNDGAGSGLDADLLDGIDSSGFAKAGGNSGALTIGTSNASALTLETNNTARVTVSTSGNVLIGTTTDNGIDKLQVDGSIQCAGGIKNTSTALSATGAILRKDSANHTKIQFYTVSTANNRLTLVISGVSNLHASVLAQVNYFNIHATYPQTASRLYTLNRLANTSNSGTFTEVGNGLGSEMSLLSTDTSVAGQQTYVFSIPAGGYPSVIFDISVHPYLSSSFSVSGSFSTV